jgi:aldehyde:ferredoxin oxidoreductase
MEVEMLDGWAGINLEIDLSRGNIEKTEVDPKLREVFLGGRGVSSKIFWDRVSPEVPAFSPDNLLIFGAGVLTGTMAPCANRTFVVTKSPQTGLLAYSGIGGFWAPELKHAGYDTIVFSGKSSSPVYLWINDDHVEIRDASHLWGKDIIETQRIIRDELGNSRIQALCIGPAGENRVYASSIEHSHGASASRSTAAVMGDKKIKAVAVRGTKDISVAKPFEFRQLCADLRDNSDAARGFFDDWPHNVHLMQGIYANFNEFITIENAQKLHADFIKKYKVRTPACFNCQLRCKVGMSLPDGGFSYLKCQSWFPFMFATKIVDLDFNIKCYHLCEKYGMDSVSTAHLVGFSIDLYDKEILTKSDTQGMHLEWGNQEVALSLIRKIAMREGIGDILANGVYEAARSIGRGAEKYAYHVKKLEMILYPPHPYTALCGAVSDKADPTRVESSLPQNYIRRPREFKEEYLKSGHFHYPKEFGEYFLADFDPIGEKYEWHAQFASYDTDRYGLADCSGLCVFGTGFWPYNPIQQIDHVKLLSFATGIEMDETDAVKIARRVALITRSYNVMSGIRRKDDTLPQKFFQYSPPLPRRKIDRQFLNKGIDRYYELRGWNKEGIPGREELHRLGMKDVEKELENRGLLT